MRENIMPISIENQGGHILPSREHRELISMPVLDVFTDWQT